MVLVVLFPLPDEKNVDVKTIFTCSQTCLLEMKPAKFKRFSSLLLGDGPTTIEKALVVNAIHSYHVDHVLNGKSVCLGGMCVGGVSKTSPFSSVPLSGTQAATTAAAAAAAAVASRIAPVSPTGTQAATTTSGW